MKRKKAKNLMVALCGLSVIPALATSAFAEHFSAKLKPEIQDSATKLAAAIAKRARRAERNLTSLKK